MPYKEIKEEDLKVYWTIGEVAEILGEYTSALRYWETEFPWLNPKKNKKGNRQYTKKDINQISDIHLLLHKIGMTAEGVRQAYELNYIQEIKDLYHARREARLFPS